MKFLPLVWKNLWRRRIRTIFTLACIFIAFLLFGMLMASQSHSRQSSAANRALPMAPNICRCTLLP